MIRSNLLHPGYHPDIKKVPRIKCSSRSAGVGGTLARGVGAQRLRRWSPPTTLAVLLVGLFFTLSLRLRKRLRARYEAGTVQAVNVDRDPRTRCCRCCCCCCCCLCSSTACCRCSGCRCETASCRASSCWCSCARGLAGYDRRASGAEAFLGGRVLMFPVQEKGGGAAGGPGAAVWLVASCQLLAETPPASQETQRCTRPWCPVGRRHPINRLQADSATWGGGASGMNNQ